MKNWNTILNWSLVALALVTTHHLRAADKPAPKEATARTVAEPDVAAAWQRRIPDLISDNLPLGEIINQLRQRFPEINFLVKQQSDSDADVNGVSVKMVLRAVTLQEILKALELASGRPIQITGGPDGRLVVFESKRAALAVDANGLPVQPDPVTSRVFSISRYLENRSEKEADVALRQLDEVIATTSRMLTDASNSQRRFKPILNFHRNTKLLIAVGRPDELEVIEQVVRELQSTPSAPATAVGTAAEKEKRREEYRKALKEMNEGLKFETNPPGEPPAGAKP
jgi:hypothetical protein